MTEVLLFHHAHGQTAGFRAFADELRAAGHVVHTPDLYEGKTFAELADGVGYAEQVGFDTIVERGVKASQGLRPDIVYAGFSLGTLPAQMLTQTREGASGALLLHGCTPTGDGHLFADPSLGEFDEGAAALLHRRLLSFLDRLE
jgi:dienelactone hydrolase